MADTPSPSPTPDDMHWGVSYLREDLQDLRQESRDFRKEVAAEFAKTRDEAGEFRQEVATGFADLRKEMGQNTRNTILVVVGMMGVFSTVIIAFMRYGMPAG